MATKAKKKPAAKKPVKKAVAKKASAKKPVAKSVKKAVAKKAAVKKVASKKPAAKKVVAKKVAPKKPAAKKVAAKKIAPKKPAAKKVVAKKVAPKKTVAKKVVAKKAVAPKTVKPAVKKIATPKVVAPKIVAPKATATKAAAKPVAKPKKSYPTLPKPKLSTKTVAEKIEERKASRLILDKNQINHKVVGPVPSIPSYQAKPGEEYMNEAQEQHFAKVLQAWKRQVMEGVDKTVGHLREDAENLADLNDRATQEEEFSLELRTRDRERKLLKKIEQALERIDHDEFGYCEACGVEIGLPRLEVRPTATLCIDCKTVEELRERQLTL